MGDKSLKQRAVDVLFHDTAVDLDSMQVTVDSTPVTLTFNDEGVRMVSPDIDLDLDVSYPMFELLWEQKIRLAFMNEGTATAETWFIKIMTEVIKEIPDTYFVPSTQDGQSVYEWRTFKKKYKDVVNAIFIIRDGVLYVAQSMKVPSINSRYTKLSQGWKRSVISEESANAVIEALVRDTKYGMAIVDSLEE